ncbi:MAG TPA: flagellar biosynthesis protein FlhB [Candidatus Paceibacterota bacterium]|nr:flagellar biosynthesis protein FlhB [Verrucomicrobiota bacterium]HRY47447.1 flagellar biosynthesis protein FlhB [Candidatus Paceibacterota bacterium]HSA01857.1 flagellar biosynthesis protein FlhB [Candidatus Paceibacterota bacterium]
MSDQFGEKTEQPTPRRIEDAIKRGQIPRSAEIQTTVVLAAVLLALSLTGTETWRYLTMATSGILGHLHEIELSFNALQGYAIQAVLAVSHCVWPLAAAAILGGLLAGGMQSRFQTASEALEVKWDRINPMEGLKRMFSFRSAVPTLVAVIKLVVIVALLYSVIKSVLTDPLFYSTVDVARIAAFLASMTMKIMLRVILAMAAVAAIDFTYQFWRNHQDLMMTRQELKDEAKNSEGNPQVKSRIRRRRATFSQRKMMLEVPQADVVITNPTHLAVALRYDPKTMRAPRIIAKGARLTALRIREIAQAHQVPIMENKPLARMLFKYGRPGGEIPAQLFAAVAEVLAWVYRTNRYRYFTQANHVKAAS